MQSTSVHIVIKSDTVNVSSIGTSINSLCSLYTTEMLAYHIDLCVSEVLSNIVEHAYNYETDKNIDIYLFIDKHSFSAEIVDYGNSMSVEQQQYINNSTVPYMDANDQHDHDLSERGRGLLIIKHVMDYVAYEACLGRNILSMKKVF